MQRFEGDIIYCNDEDTCIVVRMEVFEKLFLHEFSKFILKTFIYGWLSTDLLVSYHTIVYTLHSRVYTIIRVHYQLFISVF